MDLGTRLARSWLLDVDLSDGKLAVGHQTYPYGPGSKSKTPPYATPPYAGQFQQAAEL
jgi:hypothetical protein